MQIEMSPAVRGGSVAVQRNAYDFHQQEGASHEGDSDHPVAAPAVISAKISP